MFNVHAFTLEPRDIAGQKGWQADNIYESGRPTLWAPAKVWDALAQNELLIPDAHRPATVSVSPSTQHLKSPSSPQASWVFVPTYNRYHAKPDKQIGRMLCLLSIPMSGLLWSGHCQMRYW